MLAIFLMLLFYYIYLIIEIVQESILYTEYQGWHEKIMKIGYVMVFITSIVTILAGISLYRNIRRKED